MEVRGCGAVCGYVALLVSCAFIDGAVFVSVGVYVYDGDVS